MYTINRSVAIIKPKQPFVDWENQMPDAKWKVSLDDLNRDCLAILIPEYDTDEEAEEYFSEIYEDIFEAELFCWCTEESWWPQNRTQEMFRQLFEVDLHSIVMDPYVDPIVKEKS